MFISTFVVTPEFTLLIIPKLLDFVNFCIKVESLGVVGYVAKHIQSSHLLKNTAAIGNIKG